MVRSYDMNKRHNKISRTLSKVLRHDPASIGLALDSEGWADVGELLAGLTKNGHKTDRDLLIEVVEGGNNTRFTFSEDRSKIRANQGHSVEIDLKKSKTSPPEYLYHATAVRSMEAIEVEGLSKMKRQHVHLSIDGRAAHAAGKRHGEPIILEIASRLLESHGHKFYLIENEVWLTDDIPPDYLTRRFFM